jgi:hypothetical protein
VSAFVLLAGRVVRGPELTDDWRFPDHVLLLVAVCGLMLQRALIESGDLAKRLEALEQRLAEPGARKWA